MFRKLSAFAAALLLVPALASAQPREGDWSLTLTGSGFNSRNFDAGAFQVAVGVGHFITREIEISLRQNAGYTNLNGTTYNFATRVAGDFHFDLDEWQPFVGGNIGYIYGDAVRDTGAAAPEAGVKYYLNSRTFLYYLAEYQFFFRSGEGGFRRGQFVHSLGIGFNW